MLRIAALSDPTGRYYLADRAVELGPDEGGPGRWAGDGAADLGLVGPVTAEAMGAVLSGHHPVTGRPLVRHDRPGAVTAYDLTFAAPKTVSALFALGGPGAPGAVLEAHRAAVDEALGYVARQAAGGRRRTAGDRAVVGVDGVVAAAFTHGVSRAMDPHVHTHVVVANLGHGVDGRWSALDSRGLYAHRQAAGALYDAHLRHRLSDSWGVGWEPGPGGALEVAGVPPMLVAALSRRRAEILEAAYRHPIGRTAAWVSTRDAKVEPTDPRRLRAQWCRQADDVGVAGLDAVGRGRAAVAGRTGPDLDERRFAVSLSSVGPAGLTRRDTVAAWAGAVLPGGSASALERSVGMLADFGGAGPGVAERRVAPASVAAVPWHLRALGSRPAEPGRLDAWQRAASAIDAYRSRWVAAGDRQPLGTADGPGELARLPARRLADHLRVLRSIDDARRALGRERVTPAVQRSR